MPEAPKVDPKQKAREEIMAADQKNLENIGDAMGEIRDRHKKQEHEMYAQALVFLQKAASCLQNHQIWTKQRG